MQKKTRPRSQSVILNNCSNLAIFKAEISNCTRECTPRYIVTSCGCGRQIIKSTCHKKNCLICKDSLTLRRTLNALAKFEVYKKLCNKEGKRYIMLYTDFTIPPKLRERFIDPKEWQKFRKKIWHILKTKLGAVFALESTHPISERNPDNFHPHLNFLWVRRPGEKGFINLGNANPLKITKSEGLHDWTRKALDYKGKIVIHHNYSSDKAKCRHLIKYVVRIFPEFADWAGALRWYGNYPRGGEKDPWICPICGQVYKAVGYISADEVETYNKYGYYLGRAPPWENDEKITCFKKH